MKKEIEIKYLPMEEKKRLIKEGKMKWFFPGHVAEQIIICLFLFLLLITLATLFPHHLGEQADPFSTPDHIKPEWYFLAAYQLLKLAEEFSFLGDWAPKILGIGIQGVIIALLFAVPFLDRRKSRSYDRRLRVILVGIVAVLCFFALTIWGHFS